MARFKGVVRNCEECGGEFKVPQCRTSTAKTCSKQCADKRRGVAIERKVTLTCAQCEGAFRVPRCHSSRRIYCSSSCREASEITKARKAGMVREKNPNWLGGIVSTGDGYVYENASGHPLRSGTGYILQHRLVMERWLLENDPGSKFLTMIEGRSVLSPYYEVHHRNEMKSDNRIDNLECMTRAEHRAHHAAFVRKAIAFYRLHHSH